MPVLRCTFALAVLLVASAVAGAADEPWTFDRVVAAVEWREAQFANCSFSFSEEVSVARGGKSLMTLAADVWVRQPMTRSRYNFSRSGAPSLDLKGSEWIWDGKRSISFGGKASEPKPAVKATIEEGRPEFLKAKSMELMGTLFPEERVSAKLRGAAGRREAKVTVAEVAADRNERTVTVRVEATSVGYPVVTYAFLPEKDMLLRSVRETFFDDVAVRASPASDETVEVEQCEQREGVWVPVRTYCFRDLGGDNKNSIVYHLTAFSRAAPAADGFSVKLPPGTVVRDRIEGNVYRIEPDGSHAALSFFDADTGKVVEPPAAGPATTKPAARAN